MTPIDLGTLTLVEIEAMATRLESAARTIRDALLLMRGGPQATLAQGMALPSRPAYAPQTSQPITPILMTPEREEYEAQKRLDPQRAALLSQFRKDGPPATDEVKTEMLEAFGGGT